MRVTLKLATSLDGRIATATGESRWITGEAAREQVHRLRAAHLAVMVGVETAIADDPELTVRLPGFVGWQPARVVLDSKGRLPLTSKLIAGAQRLRTIVMTTQPALPALAKAGVKVIAVPATDGRCDPRAVLSALDAELTEQARRLAEHVRKAAQAADIAPPSPDRFKARFPDMAETGGLLIEGGGQVAASFIAAGLVDAIEWFRAPMVLGDEGRPAIGEFVLDRLCDAPRYKRIEVISLGDDLWERYERL